MEYWYPWLLKGKTLHVYDINRILSARTSKLHEITNGQILEEKHSQEEATMENS